MKRIVIVVLLSILCQTNPAKAQKWNLASDFLISPDQVNPNPDSLGNDEVWYFMESSSLQRDPATYSLLSEFRDDSCCIDGMEWWQGTESGDSCHGLPLVGINATGSDQDGTCFLIEWPDGVIGLHPFSSKLVIVGWRSPIDGQVRLEGSFSDMDPYGGNGIRWLIQRGTETLAKGGYPDGGEDFFDILDVIVNQGDFLYFVVAPGRGAHTHDSTELDLTITGPGPLLDSVDIARARYDRPTVATLTGIQFSGGGETSVLFNTAPATNVVVVDDNTITCNTPVVEPGQLNVDVTVINNIAQGTLVDAFTFTPALTLAGDWTPGGTVEVQYLLDPTNTILAIAGISPVDIPTPPFDGSLCIAPFQVIFLLVGWPWDEFDADLDIPDNLPPIDVLLQALIGPSLANPKDAAWTNCGVVEIE